MRCVCFRIWGKIFKDNHLLQDMVYENSDPDLNRTRKVYAGLHEFCMAFDLQKPIWLEKKYYGIQSVLTKPVFIRIILLSKIEFDYLEIHVIEED